MKCVNPSLSRLFAALGCSLVLAGAVRAAVSADVVSRWDFLAGGALANDENVFRLHMQSDLPHAQTGGTLVLDTFDAGTSTGSAQASTSWSGQVTQNPTSITVGGTARNENGWGATSLNLNATGLTFLFVTAQRDPGHEGSSLFLQLEDRAASTNTHIIAIDSSLFAIGVPTTVQVPIGLLSSQFQIDAIGSWSIGGGGVGTSEFRMTLHHMELSAIPEPAEVAAVFGLAAFGIALHRRRRARSSSPRP